MPIRLIFSVWATPWFARRAVVPLTNAIKRFFTRGGKITNKTPSAGAGTGAVGAGAIPKSASAAGNGTSKGSS